jgi:hypothetical protein
MVGILLGVSGGMLGTAEADFQTTCYYWCSDGPWISYCNGTPAQCCGWLRTSGCLDPYVFEGGECISGSTQVTC